MASVAADACLCGAGVLDLVAQVLWVPQVSGPGMNPSVSVPVGTSPCDHWGVTTDPGVRVSGGGPEYGGEWTRDWGFGVKSSRVSFSSSKTFSTPDPLSPRLRYLGGGLCVPTQGRDGTDRHTRTFH